MDETKTLLSEIEVFILERGTNATNFGRDALSDPNFVGDLRAGRRSPLMRTVSKVREFMAAERANSEAA